MPQEAKNMISASIEELIDEVTVGLPGYPVEELKGLLSRVRKMAHDAHIQLSTEYEHKLNQWRNEIGKRDSLWEKLKR